MPFDSLLPMLLAASEIRELWPPLWLLELLARVLLGVWLFFFGASVGSFLNVVVYRLPRGMSLVHPGSRCPTCGHAIRGLDNIPVLSWLALGGKCRDCRTPISPRYYYVELIVGLTFLLVAVFEAFLPRYLSQLPGGMGRRALGMPDGWSFWSSYATHVVLLTTLIGAALIDSDGFRVPRRLFAPVLVLGFVVLLLWPEMRRAPAGWGEPLAPWQRGLVDGVSGLVVGGLFGLVLGLCWWLKGRVKGTPTWPRFAPALSLATVGLILGWQQATLVALMSLTFFLLMLVALWGFRATAVFPFAAAVFLAAAPLVAGLDWIGLPPVPTEFIERPVGLLLFALFDVIVISLGSAMFAPPQYFSEARRVAATQDHVNPDAVNIAAPEQATDPTSTSSTTISSTTVSSTTQSPPT